MLENCKHIRKLNIARDHSILNPQKWICAECGTTESIWACLSCSHVACGRYVAEHALQHFTDKKHPVVMDINEKYVFCYVCDEYVLNDNPQGDIKLLRSILTAITTQQFEERETRSGRVLRSSGVTTSNSKQRLDQLKHADKCHTALVHRRLTLLTRMLSTWKRTTGVAARQKRRISDEAARDRQQKKERRHSVSVSIPTQQKARTTPKPAATPTGSGRGQGRRRGERERKTVITPGVTGLRNLGNTCYMNSILQVLGHLVDFRDSFLNLDLGTSPGKNLRCGSSTTRSKLYHRQTTMECLELISNPKKGCGPNSCPSAGLHSRRLSAGGGLNGGSCQEPESNIPKTDSADVKPVNNQNVLAEELHALFRVMWSGKCAMVSPQGLLNSVWRLIPSFRGYSQQDAQEFLCELLDKIQSEMMNLQQSKYLCRTTALPTSKSPVPLSSVSTALNTATNSFQGQLISQVMCLKCKHVSSRFEPFWDLSLEFPERYQVQRSSQLPQYPCDLTEMLSEFTKVERLDGKVYHCDNCNNNRRRRSTGKQQILTHAEKRLAVAELPHILRLHLKRFRWSGRYREKISVHVNFSPEVNVVPYCQSDSVPGRGDSAPVAHQHSNDDTTTTPLVPHSTLPTLDEQHAPEDGSAQHDPCSDAQDLADSEAASVTAATDQSTSRSGDAASSDDNDTTNSHDDQSHKRFATLSPPPGCERAEVNGSSLGSGVNLDGSHSPVTSPDTCSKDSSQCIYDLSAVVMHHGRGFGSGHYTSYVWNSDHGFWIHCNDARLQLCSIEDVTQAQAYILFYTRRQQRLGMSRDSDGGTKRHVSTSSNTSSSDSDGPRKAKRKRNTL